MVGKVLTGNDITADDNGAYSLIGGKPPAAGYCWKSAGSATATHLKAPATVKNNWSPALPARCVVHDLLTLPLAQRLELVQTLWDSIAAEQIGPELTESDRQLIDQRLERFLAVWTASVQLSSFQVTQPLPHGAADPNSVASSAAFSGRVQGLRQPAQLSRSLR